MDFGTVGAALSTLILGAGGAWAWFLKQKKAAAETNTDVAHADAERAVADAQHTLYKLLNQRVESLEVEIRELRAELSIERKHSRALEVHIYRLENLMRQQGIEPPEREYAA